MSIYNAHFLANRQQINKFNMFSEFSLSIQNKTDTSQIMVKRVEGILYLIFNALNFSIKRCHHNIFAQNVFVKCEYVIHTKQVTENAIEQNRGDKKRIYGEILIIEFETNLCFPSEIIKQSLEFYWSIIQDCQIK